MSYYPPMPESVSADRKVTGAPVSEDHGGAILSLARKIQKTKGVSFDRAWTEAVSQLNPEVNDNSKKPAALAGTNGASYAERNFREFSVYGIRRKVD
jgi:hypothetical protein